MRYKRIIVFQRNRIVNSAASINEVVRLSELSCQVVDLRHSRSASSDGAALEKAGLGLPDVLLVAHASDLGKVNAPHGWRQSAQESVSTCCVTYTTQNYLMPIERKVQGWGTYWYMAHRTLCEHFPEILKDGVGSISRLCHLEIRELLEMIAPLQLASVASESGGVTGLVAAKLNGKGLTWRQNLTRDLRSHQFGQLAAEVDRGGSDTVQWVSANLGVIADLARRFL